MYFALFRIIRKCHINKWYKHRDRLHDATYEINLD
jgi:hypothetical protein